MSESNDLFSEFSGVSKAQWLAQLEKDLKGKPLSDLQWQLDETITLDPYVLPEDLPDLPGPLLSHRSDNNWEIGEYISVGQIPAANAQALEALAGGADALVFSLKHEPTMEELVQLLAGIEMSYISTHFAPNFPDKDPVHLYDTLSTLLERQGKDKKTLRGSIDFDPILDWSEPPLDKLAALIRRAAADMPGFSVLQINGRTFHAGPEYAVRELAFTIAKGSEYLAQMAERGISPAETNRQLQFSMAVSTSYFVEIAKLRALRLLWANVLDGYGVTDNPPTTVVAHQAPETQMTDPNANLIRAATQAMSAVIGGVDRLYILPSNAVLEEPSTPFTRRMARNVQHILKMESYLDRVVDPAAGSYYIEKLTGQLAEKAWDQFRQIEADGGFMQV